VSYNSGFVSVHLTVLDHAIATADLVLSVCLSVRLSITFRCFVQTNEHAILQCSATGRKIILVSEEVKFIRIFAGNHPPLQQGC